MLHVIGSLFMAALTAGGFVAQARGDARAADLLAQARAALGGEAALSNVRTLSAVGHVARAAGGAQLAGDLTLQTAWPDRMLRTDSLSPDGALTVVTEQGVNGDTLLRASRTFNAPPGAVVRTPPPPPHGSDAEAQALRAAHADLARLTLALLLRSPFPGAVAYTYGGTAESPDGRADLIDVASTDGTAFAARLFLDATTHRPLMLTYKGVAPRLVVQTQRVQRGAAPPDAPSGALAAVPPSDVVDITMYLDDYRKVGALLLPHHVTRSVGGEVSEEWTLESYQLNPTFKPGTFEAK